MRVRETESACVREREGERVRVREREGERVCVGKTGHCFFQCHIVKIFSQFSETEGKEFTLTVVI